MDGLGPRHDSSTRVTKPTNAADRLAALRARVAAAASSNVPSVGATRAVGLNTPIHPALSDLSAPVKSADTSANGSYRRQDAFKNNKRSSSDAKANNPYLDGGGATTGKARQSRQLVFNQKGKYIQQAAALRRQAALEAMKKRISQTTQRAGLDEDADVEQSFVCEAPPAVEWWDEALVDGDNYDSPLKITTPDSVITIYIQHPVALEPPQEKQAPAPKPMYLTTHEQKKLRRQRRTLDMKEHQAKQRLGLEPTPPTKVKQSNLMRVLGEAAVRDPTAVEAMVNKQIRERRELHEQRNEERKLTKDQRHEKLQANQAADKARGICMVVYKIDNLSNGQHRWKIGVSAEQYALTGIVLLNPRFNLVIAEGGSWSINKFKKLMARIKWTEALPSREKDNVSTSAERDWLKAEDEKGGLKDLSSNKCVLLFEGEVKAAAFKKFGSKVCEQQNEAKEFLSSRKLDSFWNLAKNSS